MDYRRFSCEEAEEIPCGVCNMKLCTLGNRAHPCKLDPQLESAYVLVVLLKGRHYRGDLLVRAAEIKNEGESIGLESNCVAKAIELGFIEEKRIPLNNEEVLFIRKFYLDKEVVDWTIIFLEACGIIPFYSRIKDIIKSLFHLDAQDSEIIEAATFSRKVTRFSAENYRGVKEKAISFKNRSFYQSASTRSKQLMVQADIQGIPDTLIKYYVVSQTSLRKKFSAEEIYRELETPLKIPQKGIPTIEEEFAECCICLEPLITDTY